MARRKLICPSCGEPAEAEVTLSASGLDLRVWCRVHRELSLGQWGATEPRPVAVWVEGERGILYLNLSDERWVRATFACEEGEVVFFGSACIVSEEMHRTRDLRLEE